MGSANDRKPFLLRLEPATMTALKAWAAEDLRSLNAQIEFLLRKALRDAGRLGRKPAHHEADANANHDRPESPGARSTQRPGSSAARESTASGRPTR